MTKDALDELVFERALSNPDFPGLVDDALQRRLERDTTCSCTCCQKSEARPSLRATYKTIRNYVVNELKIDRAAVMLNAGQHIERATISWLQGHAESIWLQRLIHKTISSKIESEVRKQVWEVLSGRLTISFRSDVKP